MTLTHHCTGCESGRPCEACGGNVSRASPAYTALEWALAMTPPASAIGDFWATARVADVFFRSPLPDTEETHAIQSLVWRALDPTSVDGLSPSTGVNVRPPVITSGGGPAWPVPGLPAPDPPIGGGPPPVCCPLTFLYPVPTPTFDQEIVPAGASFYWEFEVLAVYKKGGTSSDGTGTCDCSCCRFKQERKGHKHWQLVKDSVSRTPVGKPVDQPVAGEDCRTVPDPTVVGRKRSVCYGIGSPELRYQEPPKNPSYEIDESLPNPPPLSKRAEELLGAALKELGMTRDSVCVYYMHDKVTMEVTPGFAFTYAMCFTGRILDRCNQDAPRMKKHFKLTMAGFVESVENPAPGNEKGTVKVDWDKEKKPEQESVESCD